MAESSGMERRITLRLLSYWERRRGSRKMPNQADINAEDLADLWEDCFIIEMNNKNDTNHKYSYIGDGVQGWLGGAEKTQDIKVLTKSYPKLFESPKPILEEGEFYDSAEQLVKFRQCLLPLGEGDQLKAILGGMRFKIFP